MNAPQARSPKPQLCLVAARGRNGVIGSGGELPWRLASDLKLFKALTRGKPVMMGRKTWESLPLRPLPGRLNIVITRQPDYAAEGACVVQDFDRALELALKDALASDADEIFVIGGAQIYRHTLAFADRLYLTEVDAAPAGEIRFPDFDETQWAESRREAYKAGPDDDHDFVFRVLERA